MSNKKRVIIVIATCAALAFSWLAYDFYRWEQGFDRHPLEKEITDYSLSHGGSAPAGEIDFIIEKYIPRGESVGKAFLILSQAGFQPSQCATGIEEGLHREGRDMEECYWFVNNRKIVVIGVSEGKVSFAYGIIYPMPSF